MWSSGRGGSSATWKRLRRRNRSRRRCAGSRRSLVPTDRWTLPRRRPILTLFPRSRTLENAVMEKRTNEVTFKNNPVTLVGKRLKAGDKAPDFKCLKSLDAVTLADMPHKALLFSVVPSLDTG